MGGGGGTPSSLSRSPMLSGSLGAGGGRVVGFAAGATRNRSSSRGSANGGAGNSGVNGRVARGPEGHGFAAGRGKPTTPVASPLLPPAHPVATIPVSPLIGSSPLSLSAQEFVPQRLQSNNLRI